MLVACLAACAFAAAAPPPNDAYPGTTLDYGAQVTGTNAEATGEDRDTAFANGTPNTVWYAFTSASDRWTTVDTCGGALDTLIAIPELQDAVSDDSEICGDEGSSITFLAQAGTTYHVMVDGYDADVGTFKLEVGPDTQPPDTALSAYSSSGFGLGSAETSTDASFDLLGFELGAYVGPPLDDFECSFDGAPFSRCASPAQYTRLALGDHEFRVRAIDAAGNADPTPAVLDWTIVSPSDLPPGQGDDNGPGGSLNPKTRAARLTLRANPERDRHKPYAFKLSGRLVPRGGATCTGTVKLQLKHAGHVLERTNAHVAKSCGYSARVKTERRGKLRVTARFGTKVSASVNVRAG